MLNRSASLAMSTSVLKALPGKFDIKRHSPRVKIDDVKLNIKQRHFKGDTVHEAVLMQNRKYRLICSNVVSTCSSRSN